MSHVTIIFTPLSLSPMSHVEFRKVSCRPVDFRGQGPFWRFAHLKVDNNNDVLTDTLPVLASVHGLYLTVCIIWPEILHLYCNMYNAVHYAAMLPLSFL